MQKMTKKKPIKQKVSWSSVIILIVLLWPSRKFSDLKRPVLLVVVVAAAVFWFCFEIVRHKQVSKLKASLIA